MNSVYGYVLEREMPNINLEFCNELAQFDYMFQSSLRESYYGDIILEGFSFKAIWVKIKELWGKFKKWVVEKFDRLREFIKRIFHKTKKDVVDKKIGNNPSASNKSRELSDSDDPQYFNFIYNEIGSTDYIGKLTDIKTFTVLNIIQEECEDMIEKINYTNYKDLIDLIKSKIDNEKEKADSNYEKVANIDFSDIKEIEEKIPFRGVDTDKFKDSVKSSMQKIQNATKAIMDKLIRLNKYIDNAQDSILDMEQELKRLEGGLDSLQQKRAKGISDDESDIVIAKIAPTLIECVKYDISRCRNVVLQINTHCSNLLNAVNKNNIIFGKLERVYSTDNRPTASTIEGLSKQSV